MKIEVHLRDKRSCGTCSLCCTVMGVVELQKEKNVRCKKLTPLGRCSIYGQHPESCKTYQCLWLQGAWPIELKPHTMQAVPMTTTDGKKIVLHVAKGAGRVWESGVLRRFLDSMAAKGIPTIVSYGEERIVIGSPDELDGHVLLFEEESLDGKTTQYLQLTRAPKRGDMLQDKKADSQGGYPF